MGSKLHDYSYLLLLLLLALLTNGSPIPTHPALMGFSQCLALLSSLIFFLLFSPPPSSAIAPSPIVPERDRQVFHVAKPRHGPYPSYGRRTKNSEWRRKVSKRSPVYDLGARTFSAMLPRGFVPPSGSTWCHNDAPYSIDPLCDEKSVSRP